MPNVSAIRIDQLVKRFGTVTAVAGVSLDIRPGEFFGLLGPNGAGKTTLISCIVGLARPTTGRVMVCGDDVVRAPLRTKAQIGFAPQEVNVEYFFPIQRILEFQGGYNGLSRAVSRARADALLRQFGLWERRDVQYFRLSGGMQKRLMIARALIAEPRVLILDEPTAGVDVEQRHALWEVLRALKAGGTTIVLTSHYIDEVELLCERVGVIHQGTLVELGTPQELIARYCEQMLTIDLATPVHADMLGALDAHVAVLHEGRRLQIRTRHGDERIGPLTQDVLRRLEQIPDCRVVDLHITRGDLEQVFLKVTGSRMTAEAAA
ncbi:MAG: ABC transporter ATP-binding protein [Deltaproteobacteria bacterium]|nr:ABC transporter ATP-binding protein [Deltaproteobacteria bacterium]